jgi:membrane complex biogenesis BtpA family protein
MKLDELFSPKPIIGVVHLLPLPGSPKYGGESDTIIERAMEEVGLLNDEGVSGIIIENFNDIPFSTQKITRIQFGLMASILTQVRSKVNIPIGVNVHFNNWESEIALAYSCKAQFVRVEVFVDTVITASGIVEPCCAEVTRYRRQLNAEKTIQIWADIHPKYSKNVLPISLAESAGMAQHGLADVIIVTGETTGKETPIDDIVSVKSAIDLPVIVGSGVNSQNIRKTLAVADGVIVGSAFKIGGDARNRVSKENVKNFFKQLNL